MKIYKYEDLIKQNYDNLQLLVNEFTIHNMSAFHRQGIPYSKDNYAHGISCPTERNQ